MINLYDGTSRQTGEETMPDYVWLVIVGLVYVTAMLIAVHVRKKVKGS